MLNALKNLQALVTAANALSAQAGEGENRWTLFLTNRSFIAFALAAVISTAAGPGVPLDQWVGQISPEKVAGQVVEALTAALILWGFVERLRGTSRAVWNRVQGVKAVEEAAALIEASPAPTAEAIRATATTLANKGVSTAAINDVLAEAGSPVTL